MPWHIVSNKYHLLWHSRAIMMDSMAVFNVVITFLFMEEKCVASK